MTDYAKENLSTEQPSQGEDPRIQSPHGEQKRTSRLKEAPCQGSQASDSDSLLKLRNVLPKNSRLRNSSEYRTVYSSGEKYDGSLMTAFVFRNGFNSHRLGITASRKLASSAVKRNRAKRLLREAFRASGTDLGELRHQYDWVLNAKRGLLRVKAADSYKEFRKIVAIVGRKESEAA